MPYTNTTIASGQAVSTPVKLATDEVIVCIHMPTEWDTANLTFLAAERLDGTYRDVYTSANQEVELQVAANRAIVVDRFTEGLDFQFFKVRSGTTGTPVNQTADRQVILETKQMTR